jgi:nicotinate-nucleotide adenylyltransferase
MTRTERVGIFGGTFNPIHLGHLRAAQETREILGLERILFVPSAQPPHKSVRGERVAAASQRLDWVRRALEGNPGFAVDDLEIERGGRSYSVDTLREIGARTAPELPVFVLGCDAFAELDAWREPEALFALAHFAVMTRPPATRGALGDWLPKCIRDEVEVAEDGLAGRYREAGTWIRLLPISALDISSSDIRARIRAGRSVRYLVPEAVREEVERCEAYGAAGSGPTDV